MKRKSFYLVHCKNHGCFPYVFSSFEKANLYVDFVRESHIHSDLEFLIVRTSLDVVGSISAVKCIKNEKVIVYE